MGYPQQLRIILGIAKPLGAIALLVPGMAKLKEWAYAGFTFAWISAFFAHYLAGDGPIAFSPLLLLVVLVASYLTLPARGYQAKVTSLGQNQDSGVQLGLVTGKQELGPARLTLALKFLFADHPPKSRA